MKMTSLNNTLIILIAADAENKSPRGISYEHLKADATKAGYDNVYKYKSEVLNIARLYQECVADPFEKKTLCTGYKELWLENRTAKNGNKGAWKEEEIHKMIKEDAAKAGHKDGYYRKKDPQYTKISAFLYEECVAKSGAENSLCKLHKRNWLQSMMAQNGKEVSWSEAEVRKMMKKDAAQSGFK